MSDAKTRETELAAASAVRWRIVSRAGAQIPAGDLRRPDRSGCDGAHRLERVRDRPHSAGLDPDRRARRRQDHDGAHSRARAELRVARRLGRRPDHRDAGARRALPGDHGKPAHRRARDGRRLAQRRRRRAPDQRRHPLCAGERALQGLYPRRSAHAVDAGVQRACSRRWKSRRRTRNSSSPPPKSAKSR